MYKRQPHWNVLEGDIKNFSFKEFENKIDVVTGGFPCQAFSYAGKKLGLNDARAVSYTHLDVYKRQLLMFGSKLVPANLKEIEK